MPLVLLYYSTWTLHISFHPSIDHSSSLAYYSTQGHSVSKAYLGTLGTMWEYVHLGQEADLSRDRSHTHSCLE